MNLSRIESYARELAALMQNADQLQAEVDKVTAFISAADGPSELARVPELRTRRDAMLSRRDALLTASAEKANRAPERINEFLTDLDVRINAAHEEFRRYRQVVAEFEFQVAQGALDETTRPQMEAAVASAKMRAETRERLASDMMPNKPLVLVPR